MTTQNERRTRIANGLEMASQLLHHVAVDLADDVGAAVDVGDLSVIRLAAEAARRVSTKYWAYHIAEGRKDAQREAAQMVDRIPTFGSMAGGGAYGAGDDCSVIGVGACVAEPFCGPVSVTQ